jgi:type II secretory pathway pseudopilin PulG
VVKSRSERGQGLVELLIALTVLALAVGALISVLVAGAVALQRTDQKGTATTLADKQLEVYRTFAYSNIRLTHTLPAAGTTYAKAHLSNSDYPSYSISTFPGDIPPASGCLDGTYTPTPPAEPCLVVDNTNSETPCTGSPLPVACTPVQTVTGPDQRSYEIDTYITYCNGVTNLVCGTSTGVSHGAKQVLVVVRDPTRAGSPILARVDSIFQPLTVAKT